MDTVISDLDPAVQPLVTICNGDFFSTFGHENLHVLGRGMSGVVNLSISPDGGYQALKILPKDLHSNGAINKLLFEKEVSILSDIRHRNIVEIVMAYESPDSYILAMPFYSGGDLKSRLRDIQYNQIGTFFLQITSAVMYLHNHSIAHRDIKPDNILISSEGNAVLTDFGLACVVMSNESLLEHRLGTPAYGAPEMIGGFRNDVINFYKCDMYSLGLTLWSMVVRDESVIGQTDHLDHLPPQRSIRGSYRYITEHLINKNAQKRWDLNQLTSVLWDTWPQMGYNLGLYLDCYDGDPETSDDHQNEHVLAEYNQEVDDCPPNYLHGSEGSCGYSTGNEPPAMNHHRHQNPIETPYRCYTGYPHSHNPHQMMIQSPVMPPAALESWSVPQPFVPAQPFFLSRHPVEMVPALFALDRL